MIILCVFLFSIIHSPVFSDQTITAIKTSMDVPLIDGFGDDPAWQGIDAIITHADLANVDVEIKALRNDKMIFFLVQFPDKDESRTHKSLYWNKSTEMYDLGPDREDCFVFKWNMGADDADLSVYSHKGHGADIWFWKACRTDPSGFADDKKHILSIYETRKSKPIKSKTGNTLYLQRIADKGIAAYSRDIYIEYKGDVISEFMTRQPKGSRADIKAKGNWQKGKWTIEFQRALDTGYMDDVAFAVGGKYQFGIALSEIAGKPLDLNSNFPLYGADDVSENLYLRVK